MSGTGTAIGSSSPKAAACPQQPAPSFGLQHCNASGSPAPHMQMPPMHISPLPGKHCGRKAWQQLQSAKRMREAHEQACRMLQVIHSTSALMQLQLYTFGQHGWLLPIPSGGHLLTARHRRACTSAHSLGLRRSRSSWYPLSHRCTARRTSCPAAGSRQRGKGWLGRGCLMVAARRGSQLGRQPARREVTGCPPGERARQRVAVQACCHCWRRY